MNIAVFGNLNWTFEVLLVLVKAAVSVCSGAVRWTRNSLQLAVSINEFLYAYCVFLITWFFQLRQMLSRLVYTVFRWYEGKKKESHGWECVLVYIEIDWSSTGCDCRLVCIAVTCEFSVSQWLVCLYVAVTGVFICRSDLCVYMSQWLVCVCCSDQCASEWLVIVWCK